MKKALILNRRCIKHPERGGAEVYTYYLAKSLIDLNYNVVWFSSYFKGAPKQEEIDGIKFIRMGNELTCHFWGFLYANKIKWDLIVDEFNGVGFFCFFKKNSVLLIHQLYGEFWKAQFGTLGKVFVPLEKISLKLYKLKPTITVSQSTLMDLTTLGFTKTNIIYNGLDMLPEKTISPKEEKLTLVYLGRFKATKQPEEAIKAYLYVKAKFPEARLIMIGDGPLFEPLRAKYGNVNGISFLGYVDESTKYEVLKKAHFLLIPSLREGWGQVVIQANAMGTPAIGYNVMGLKDSIKNGQTGILVANAFQMAEKVLELWNDKKNYLRLSLNAILWAKEFSWENTKKEFVKFFVKEGFFENPCGHTHL